MARRYIFNNSLAAGEIAPEYLMRTDTQFRGEAAKQFRNATLMAGGGWRRRPGTDHLAALTGIARLDTYGTGEDDARLLTFLDEGFEVRDLEGDVAQAVVDAPWAEADLFTMQIAIEDNRIVVASESFFPQQIVRTAGLWGDVEPLVFATGIDGATLQPYWRFHERGVSLTVGAYSGTGVSLETSAAHFIPAHVGARVRYTGIEIAITAVTDSTNATGTIVGSLYPTLNVTVGSTAGFAAGQVVSGENTQIQGVIAAVSSGTVLNIQLTDGYTPFDATEPLIGPTAKSTISGIATATLPAATVEWDEQLISAARGYPRACALHRNRLLLGDFPQAQNVMAASATGDITDFNVGTGLDTDAIIERVSREGSLGIKHFGSTEQLLIFTEAGPYYIPEQVASPLSPTNFEILKIGPEAAATPTPILVSEGMTFIERNSGRLMIALPTGNVRRSWDIGDLSELGFHLMGVPVEMDLLAANTQTDRQVFVLRDDGQLAVLVYRRGGTFSAWGLWTTTGAWRSIVASAGRLYAVSERDVGGETVYALERFRDGAWADGMLSLDALDDPAAIYADDVVGVWVGPSKLGEFDVDEDGVLIGVDDFYTAVQVGLDFPVTVEVVPPIDGEMGLRPKLKITRVDVDCIASVGFKGDGRDPGGWSGGTIGGATQPQSGVRRFRPLGRAKDRTFTITQTEGGPLEVRSITMEVTS